MTTGPLNKTFDKSPEKYNHDKISNFRLKKRTYINFTKRESRIIQFKFDMWYYIS